MEDIKVDNKITVLGLTFNSDEERRTYFREELRKKLPELKEMEGFPIGDDEDILNLSDPPYYTACPNPWLNDFVAEWEEEKKQLEKEGKRDADFEVDEPYAADVSEGKNNPIYNAHSYHTKVPHPAIMRYILNYTQPGDIILDGFGGSGMTGVAATICKSKKDVDLLNKDAKYGKRHAILNDLSPVAGFISSNFNSNLNAFHLKTNSEKIYKKLVEKYNWMYETTHLRGKKGIIEYTLWSDVFECTNCGEESVFLNDAWNKKDNKIEKEWYCKNCGNKITKDSPKVFETKFDQYLNTSVKASKSIPVLINYKYDKKRYLKTPDQDDLNLLAKIDEFRINNWFPTDKLHVGFNTSQPINSNGIEYIHQFYTKRSLIILAELFDAVPSKFLLTNILSRNSTKLNRFVVNKHNPNGRINGPLTGTLYVPSESVEQNPLNLFKDKLPKINWELKNAINQTGSSTDLKNITDDSIDYNSPRILDNKYH